MIRNASQNASDVSWRPEEYDRAMLNAATNRVLDDFAEHLAAVRVMRAQFVKGTQLPRYTQADIVERFGRCCRRVEADLVRVTNPPEPEESS